MKWKKQPIDKYLMPAMPLLMVFLLGLNLLASERSNDKVETDALLHSWRKMDSIKTHLPFAIDSLCYIQDEKHTLDPFLAQLDSLLAGKDTVVRIVHLGDSHLQAGYYSGEAMRLLQEQFGNAGRGWIAPFKLSRSNEPEDYFIRSVVKEWKAGRCIQNNPACPWGIGGIGIETMSPSATFTFGVTPEKGAGYDFKEAILYRAEKSMPMVPYGTDKDSVRVFRADTLCAPDILADTFRLSSLTASLPLEPPRRKQGTDSLLPAELFTNRYYGFSLSNGKPGLLYHTIGVNGAMYVNYTSETYVKQLAVLKPALLIISLGTNEAFGRNFTEEEFTGQIDAFLRLARKEMPNTVFLLTTPAECYKRIRIKKRRRYVRNESMARMAGAIARYAQSEGIACWDLFAATGGKQSCKLWLNAGLFRADHIHFTPEGYKEQGKLLYKALVRLKKEEKKEDAITN